MNRLKSLIISKWLLTIGSYLLLKNQCALVYQLSIFYYILRVLIIIFIDYWKLSAQMKVDAFIGQILNDIEFYQGKYKNLFKVVPVQKCIRNSLQLVTLYYSIQEFKVGTR